MPRPTDEADAFPAALPPTAAAYRAVRDVTTALAAPLAVEDQGLQSMPDCSPVRWHLAHTTWFFETFVLKEAEASFRPFHPAFESLFNSYYQAVGTPFPRERRGLLSRPTVAEVQAWRRHVDDRVADLFRREALRPHLLERVALGLEHERQHQELILTDVLHALAQNPLRPAYRTGGRPRSPSPPRSASAASWIEHAGGLVSIGAAAGGAAAGGAFACDNERPRHAVHLEPFALASRLVTNSEYDEFVAAGGYRDPRWWLSEGFAFVREQGIERPLYREDDASEFTLDGVQPVDPAAPVVHVSLFEADAYARWRGLRLPTEAEWETIAATSPVEGNFLESGRLHPEPAVSGAGEVAQLYGDVWEWTASPYSPYPGFRIAEGAIGEYNGKFMIHQTVLRGGSCVTPRATLRASYRNFFPAGARWQFAGIRLARDLA